METKASASSTDGVLEASGLSCFHYFRVVELVRSLGGGVATVEWSKARQTILNESGLFTFCGKKHTNVVKLLNSLEERSGMLQSKESGIEQYLVPIEAWPHVVAWGAVSDYFASVKIKGVVDGRMSLDGVMERLKSLFVAGGNTNVAISRSFVKSLLSTPVGKSADHATAGKASNEPVSTTEEPTSASGSSQQLTNSAPAAPVATAQSTSATTVKTELNLVRALSLLGEFAHLLRSERSNASPFYLLRPIVYFIGPSRGWTPLHIFGTTLLKSVLQGTIMPASADDGDRPASHGEATSSSSDPSSAGPSSVADASSSSTHAHSDKPPLPRAPVTSILVPRSKINIVLSLIAAARMEEVSCGSKLGNGSKYRPSDGMLTSEFSCYRAGAPIKPLDIVVPQQAQALGGDDRRSYDDATVTVAGATTSAGAGAQPASTTAAIGQHNGHRDSGTNDSAAPHPLVGDKRRADGRTADNPSSKRRSTGTSGGEEKSALITCMIWGGWGQRIDCSLFPL